LQNLQFLRTDLSTGKLSSDGTPTPVIGIRAEKFKNRCEEENIMPVKPDDLRTTIQTYGLGTLI